MRLEIAPRYAALRGRDIRFLKFRIRVRCENKTGNQLLCDRSPSDFSEQGGEKFYRGAMIKTKNISGGYSPNE